MVQRFIMLALMTGFLVASISLLPPNAMAETPKPVEYIWLSKAAYALAAMPAGDDVIVFGTKSFLYFDDKVKREGGYAGSVGAHFAGPLGFDGYVQAAQPLHGSGALIAGVDHKGGGWFSFDGDNRRGVVLKMSPFTSAHFPEPFKVEKLAPVDDRVPYAVTVGRGDEVILLSGAEQSHFTLTIYDADLATRQSVTFGIGGGGDVAITQNGDLVVVGFERSKEGHDDQPAYWEYSPKLELVKHKILDSAGKSSSSGDVLMRILVHEKDVYLLYGWENCSGCKREGTSVLWLEKLQGDSTWKQAITYDREAKLSLSREGEPLLLEPKKDAVHEILFSRDGGRQQEALLERPSQPVECFPPEHYYQILGVFPTSSGDDHIVFTIRPLDSYEAGCVAIGKVKL